MQPQKRTRTATHYYNNTNVTSENIDTENQEFTTTQDKNITVNTSNINKTGIETNCTSWSPLENTVNSGDSFQQSQSCDAETNQLVTYLYNEIELEQNVIIGNIEVTHNQDNTGTKTGIITMDGSQFRDQGYRIWRDNDTYSITDYFTMYPPVVTNVIVGQSCTNFSQKQYVYSNCDAEWIYSSRGTTFKAYKKYCDIQAYSCL